MTIYVVMQAGIICRDVPVSAWRTMTEATLDTIRREQEDANAIQPRTYTIVPVHLGGEK